MLQVLLSGNLLYYLSALIGFAVIYFIFFKKKPVDPDSSSDDEKKEEEIEDPNAQKMTILYASQTGTAEDFSRQFASEAKRYGFAAKVVDLIDYNPESLNEENLVVFMVATYGEGEPTDNSRDFYEWVNSKDREKDQLSKLKYVIFGLGNKQYRVYQAVARLFDKKFQEMGATNLYVRGEGDADSTLEEDFEEWKQNVFPILSQKYNTKTSSDDNKFIPKFKFQYYEEKDIKLKTPYDQPTRGFPDQKFPYLAKVIEKRELLKINDTTRSSIHIEFNTEKSNIYYEEGDHLAVYPENEKEIVNEYLKMLNVEDAEKIIGGANIKDNKALFPKKTTIRTILSYYLHLNAILKKQNLKILSFYAEDEKEKEELSKLASNDEENKLKFKKYITDPRRNLCDVLKDYKSIKLPIEVFLEIMPRLQPRYYSIASSPSVHPNSIHLLVAVVRYKTSLKAINGVCSHFISQLEKGSSAYIFVRKSTFHLPDDSLKPLIFIGPGTGFAPMRGFLQKRIHQVEVEKKKVGKAHLYFGCRNKNEDYIYEDEQVESLKKGAISGHYVAFSRDQKEKVYVQNKMEENGSEIWEMISKGGYIFVCGDAKYMAKDVDATIEKIIIKYGNKTETEAKALVEKLLKNNRYLRDVWSP